MPPWADLLASLGARAIKLDSMTLPSPISVLGVGPSLLHPHHPSGCQESWLLFWGRLQKHGALEKRDCHAGNSGSAQRSPWAWAAVLLLDSPWGPVPLSAFPCCPCSNDEAYGLGSPLAVGCWAQGECSRHLNAASVFSTWSRTLDLHLGHTSPLPLLFQVQC